ncbi:MAG TPA: 1,6-anhydro-N-acetylmuramyl-L-alanine amidase AmpD [Burkholderiaceae bacterium]|nr:1,6-anhydro-N-acetylmuramyl-L-alanine amidase AmpD [Burkholderiaceae bacterium]
MAPSVFSVGPDGWVAPARRHPSPNCDARPTGTAISLVVIHNISLPPGCYGGVHVERLFTNGIEAGEHPILDRLRDAKVSAHFFIDRAGGSMQFVSCLERAWHAGASSFKGRARCNDFSIGIELEGTDFEPFVDKQYVTLNALLAALAAAFPLEAIVGHSDIALDRKTDPGPFFCWNRLDAPSHLLAR